MQPNSITLVVDPANNSTTEEQVFNRTEELVNRSSYFGPNHTLAVPETLQFYRTMPVRSGDFLGALKTSAKFTKVVSVETAEGETSPRPLIIEVSLSVPVGTDSADVVEARQRVLALLDRDDIMTPLNGLGVI